MTETNRTDRKVNTVLFDFDGTLVNTNDVIIASWQHTYMHYRGREESPEKITACFGEPLLLTMAREFPEVDPEESAEVYRRYQQQYAEELVKIFPGIKELLESLKKSGFRMGIVTSRTRESLDRYLNMFAIGSYFEAMVTCEDTDIHKPNPEPILLCLKKMDITAEEAVMVGDSPFDIKCANNAGVKSVLVDWRITESGHTLIDDAKEVYIIEEPAELINILESLNR